MRTETVILTTGLTVGDQVHKEAVLREVLTVQEMFDAEQEAPVDRPLAFRGALLARQLERVGTFTGPFTLEMIGKLTPGDFAKLRAAQQRLDTEGNGE